MRAIIQFVPGLNETVLPEIQLTRSIDGSTGTAQFQFKNPIIFKRNTLKRGEITGMYLIDQEGVLETREINTKFREGKPEMMEAIYVMKSSECWNRFMRFMQRYSQTNNLIFTKANSN